MNCRPYLLLAELTHRCPLHCPYCSNPSNYPAGQELGTAEWERVIGEAAEMGVLHVGFSGGEPLLRCDLSQLISTARTAGLYTNLITSALGLNESRAEELQRAGLESIQISFQSDQPELADVIAGARAHSKKLEAARLVREMGFPLTVNVVLHRWNIGRLGSIIRLAAELGAERLELANTQYYGWAFRNRSVLLPTREQIAEAERVAARAKEEFAGKLEILFVIPDYYTERPKPCMNGWGRRFLTVNPVGDVLPCPTASEIKGMHFENIRSRSLDWIWSESEAFSRFRGTEWMPDPCRSCEFREVDFGGCRCQAALIAGDATVTDPACSLSPYRHKLVAFVESCQDSQSPAQDPSSAFQPAAYRQNPPADPSPSRSADFQSA